MKMWKHIVKFTIFSILLLSCFKFSVALVVPGQLASITEHASSRIQLKKGTDSRLGFGFRLGKHADFQVVLELGPQNKTRPIGDQEKSKNSFNKRHISRTQQKALLRQPQLQQELSSTERTASKWLENWSEDMNSNKKHSKTRSKQQQRHPLAPKTQHEKRSPVPTASRLPEQSLKQLQLLYKLATTSTSTTTTTTAPFADTVETIPTSSTTMKPFLGGSLNSGGPAGFQLPQDMEMPSQLLSIVQPRKAKGEITSELMNVSMEAEE